MKTALEQAIEQADKIQDEHPYKVAGNHNTYCEYNEGWSNAIDRISSMLTELLPTERQHLKYAFEDGMDEESGFQNFTDYFTQTFKND